MKAKPTIKSFAGLKAGISGISLLISLILTSFALQSQEYLPMAVEGAQWIIKYDDIDTPQPVDNLWEYYATGDTSVDNQTWKKIYRRNLLPSNEPPPFEASGEYELSGLMRDDVLNRQVYAILMDDNGFCAENQEILLYDFSLEPEDTAGFCLIPEHVDFVVESVSQGMHLNFETTIFSDGFQYNYYEGMGSGFGLFEPMFIPLKSGSGKSLYQTYLYYYCREVPCNLVLSTEEISTGNEMFRVYPNPAKNNVNVAIPDEVKSGQVVIMNAQGQILQRKTIQESYSEINFGLTELAAGLYTVAIIREGSFVVTRKFVVIE